jgi:transposase
VPLLTAGNTHDISMVRHLVEAAGPARRLIADRGHDAAHLRGFPVERGMQAVIPCTTARRVPIPHNAEVGKRAIRSSACGAA